MAARVLLGSALGLAVMLAGWDSASTALPPERPPAASDAQHELGRKVYNFRCYFCHGYSGDARTLAATYLQPRPRDFAAATPATLPPQAVLAAVRDGRAGTAMKSFRGIVTEAELQAVAAFVSREFVEGKARNTAYHTAENGWPGHERHQAAFPFARGEIAQRPCAVHGQLRVVP
jgi:cytochrome c oxidase cbb3-type subunit 3